MSRVEELKKKAEAFWEACHGCNESDRDMWINSYIKGALANQIELPTDEEIHKESDNYVDNDHVLFVTNSRNSKRYGFSDGAKWMRDKIKGGGE